MQRDNETHGNACRFFVNAIALLNDAGCTVCHLQASDGLEHGVSVPVQCDGEQLRHFRPAVRAGWQADGVHQDQTVFGAGRRGPKLGEFLVIKS